MDFAKKILGKYGWKEGDGLGKNNNGIAAPLKASLKFDNAGLGVDRAKEFNDHWWERCFNEAASNVTVQVEKDGKVSTARKQGEEAVEISTKGYSARKLKKAKAGQQHADGGAVYDHFLKSALLIQSGGEVPNAERIQVDDIAVSKINILTDEELFKACGGRTAHKGARHGLKLSGKLARLEQQEREMLAKLQPKKNDNVELESTKSKKKKRGKDMKPDSDSETEYQSAAINDPGEPNAGSKKSRKDNCVPSEDLEPENSNIENVKDLKSHLPVKCDEIERTKAKKKKQKDTCIEPTESKSANASAKIEKECEIQMPAKSKKSRMDTSNETELPVKPKKKKNKRKHEE